MSQWFFTHNGIQGGPTSGEQIRAMAAQGQLGPDDLLWRDGMTQWQPARSVGELFPPGPPGPAGVAVAQPVNYPTPPGYAYGPSPNDIGQDAGIRMLLPVGRSGWAIAAGYLGLFSFVVFPAPIALIISIIALRDMKRNPRKHGMGRAIFGLVMGILGSIALAIGIVAIALGK
jgi:hypothetical protein